MNENLVAAPMPIDNMAMGSCYAGKAHRVIGEKCTSCGKAAIRKAAPAAEVEAEIAVTAPKTTPEVIRALLARSAARPDDGAAARRAARKAEGGFNINTGRITR
jgi:hypothetical protein